MMAMQALSRLRTLALGNDFINETDLKRDVECIEAALARTAVDVESPPLSHVACLDTEDRVWSLPRPFRHHNVLAVMWFCGAKCAEDNHYSQGFLDTNGRYLPRKAALISAGLNGQILSGKIIGGVLTSEDLW